MKIEIPVSFGEVVDKCTILEIKIQNIPDAQNAKKELAALVEKKQQCPVNVDYFTKLLKNINTICWDQMEILRSSKKMTDAEYVCLTKECLQINDERARVKRKIDECVDSDIREQKSYEKISCIFLGHLGIRDQFTSNGIVRFLSTIYDVVHVVYKKGQETMKQMYQDDPTGIKLMYINDDSEIPHALQGRKEDVIAVGCYQHLSTRNPVYLLHPLSHGGTSPPPPPFFFQQDRWFYQHCPRNLDREEAFYSRITIGKPYIFIHNSNPKDDKRHKISASDSNNMFDYGLVMERAEELHLKDSSFFCLLFFLNWKDAKWKRLVFYQRSGAPYDLRAYIPPDFCHPFEIKESNQQCIESLDQSK